MVAVQWLRVSRVANQCQVTDQRAMAMWPCVVEAQDFSSKEFGKIALHLSQICFLSEVVVLLLGGKQGATDLF